ncbi:MAG: hypothetical protein EXR49_02515 [Dehalococcoidia bacterium]|nr:hypothetical protein [Dehalococcoidia bacterium]
MKSLDAILSDPRLTVRRSGEPDPDGKCVVYWMQRAQRAVGQTARGSKPLALAIRDVAPAKVAPYRRAPVFASAHTRASSEG